MTIVELILGDYAVEVYPPGSPPAVDARRTESHIEVELGPSLDPDRVIRRFRARHILNSGELELCVSLNCTYRDVAPTILLLPDPQMLVCAFDEEVNGVCLRSGQVRFVSVLSGRIRTVRYLGHLGLVLVIHDLGAGAVSLSGDTNWDVSIDLLEGFLVSEDRVELFFYDAHPVAVDLSTGQLFEPHSHGRVEVDPA
jgi:hypothetical protein